MLESLLFLQLIGTAAGTGAEGRAAMQPLHSLLSSREPLWRDLKCLDEAAKVSALLS